MWKNSKIFPRASFFILRYNVNVFKKKKLSKIFKDFPFFEMFKLTLDGKGLYFSERSILNDSIKSKYCIPSIYLFFPNVKKR